MVTPSCVFDVDDEDIMLFVVVAAGANALAMHIKKDVTTIENKRVMVCSVFDRGVDIELNSRNDKKGKYVGTNPQKGSGC
jgi:hypothetical protein